MEEAIPELRSAIRRIRPCLLLNHWPSPSALPERRPTPLSGGLGDGDGRRSDDDGSVVPAAEELRLEAASELVDAVASLVWNLDCLWGSFQEGNADGDEPVPDGPRSRAFGAKKDVENGNGADITESDKIGNCGRESRALVEPHTEWNEGAKSLIREGYGLVAAASRQTSIFVNEGGENHLDDDSMREKWWQQQHREAMKTLARNSILDLLPSVSTTPCRHFLLAFLPYFMPLTSLNEMGGEDDGVPSWLKDSDDEEESFYTSSCHRENNLLTTCRSQDEQSIELVADVITKLVETFQSLIHTDVSTLAPFLAALTTLFKNISGGADGGVQSGPTYTDQKPLEVDAQEDVKSAVITDPNTSRESARVQCFHLCISSMPAVFEHDLPSLLHSLFTLVRNDEEGRMAMEAVRAECMSLRGSNSSEATKKASLGTVDDPAQDGGHLVAFIGNLTSQSILSGQMPGSSHLARGFFGALESSLRHSSFKEDGFRKKARDRLTPLASLDAIILVALFSNPAYRCSVESIVDSMSVHQSLSFLRLMDPLIQSWSPPNFIRGIARERENSLLYDTLASPLITLLFHIMISSSLVERDGMFESALMGGILPFHMSTPLSKTSTATNASGSCTVTDACCRVFSELFSAVDPQRQEQIVNSLLSMVTDSFVRSTPSEYPSKRNRRRISSASTTKERRSRQVVLLGVARAACRVLLLISNRHASDLLQIKGTVLDRLMMLASMSVPTASSSDKNEEGKVAIAHHLFDMNCAIIISLLHDANRGSYYFGEEDKEAWHSTTAADVSGRSSELLILCQKLLFSANFTSAAASVANNGYQHRAVCGIILASRLLRCKLIPSGERESVWSWVLQVISPSSSAATPLQALDPEIAQWGLTFLRFASSVILSKTIKLLAPEEDSDPRFPEMSCFLLVQPVCGPNDVFNQVNGMLATAAIVQMEDSLRLPSLCARAKSRQSVDTPPTFLAFTEVSAYDHLHKKKPPATTRMVICAPYFLNGTLVRKGCSQKSIPLLTSINSVADYVYDLVDRYLELGTSKTETWNPRGWLLAKIQLPCCLTGSSMQVLGMKEDYGLELDADLKEHKSGNSTLLKFDVDANSDSFHRQWKLLFADKTTPKAAVIQNLLEFVNSVIISISVSCAVLKHAHKHFEREEAQLTTMGSSASSSSTSDILSDAAVRIYRRKGKRLEALRKLLQFQVNKIHTLQQLSKNICLALNGLHAEMCKLTATRSNLIVGTSPMKEVESNAIDDSADPFQPRQKGVLCNQKKIMNKGFYEQKQIPLSELRTIISSTQMFLSSRANTIANPILWSCLDDDIDDTILLESLGKFEPNTNEMAIRILCLRRNILQYLQHNTIQLNSIKTGTLVPDSEEWVHFSNALSVSGISRVFRMAISLTPSLNNIDKILGNALPKSSLDADFSYAIVGSFLLAHYKLLLAVFSLATKGVALRSRMKNTVLSATRKQAPEPTDTSSGFSWFADITEKCAQSVPSLGHTIDPKLPGADTCSSTSLSTHTDALSKNLLQQLNCCEDASISCHIIDLLSILYMHTNSLRGVLSTLTSGTLHSVFYSSVGQANLPYSFLMINDILVRASKKEVHDSGRTSIIKHSFTSLIRTSNSLLKVKNPFTVAFVHHLLAHWSVLIFEGASHFQCLTDLSESVDAFLSTAFRRSKRNYPSPRLRKVLPGLNEKTYTHLFELLLHMTGASFSLSKPHRSKTINTSKVCRVKGPYGEVIWPLEVYGKLVLIFRSNHVFFPRRFILTVVKSSLLMLELSDFQLRQCVQWRSLQHSPMGLGKDFAAAEFLQPLVNSVATHCIGTIISFSETIKGLDDGEKRSWGSSNKHAKAVAGLLFRCAGIKETLQNICLSQNLMCPKYVVPHQNSNCAPKRKREQGGCDDVKRKFRSSDREMSPQRNSRSCGSSAKMLASHSVLELLPESSHNKFGPHSDFTNSNSVLWSDSEESRQSEDDNSRSILDSDSDSFGAIGDWAT